MADLNRELKLLRRAPLYSEELGINLGSRREEDLFRWLIASYLLGSGVNPTVAVCTYPAFEARILAPHDMAVETFKFRFGLSLRTLHKEARDPLDLEFTLRRLGMNELSANFFLRELRPHWLKADPKPLPSVYREAEELGIDLDCMNRRTKRFVRIEAGLTRRLCERIRPEPGVRQFPLA